MYRTVVLKATKEMYEARLFTHTSNRYILLCFAGQLSRKSWEMAPVYVTI